jgi:hypothetical protein
MAGIGKPDFDRGIDQLANSIDLPLMAAEFRTI